MTFFAAADETDASMLQFETKLRRLRGVYLALFIMVTAWAAAAPAVFLLLAPHLILVYSGVITLLLAGAALCWVLFARTETQAYAHWRLLRAVDVQR